MAYDEELADRIRTVLVDEPGVEEKRGFGGLMFLVGGNMAFAATSKGRAMLRCAADLGAELVSRPGVAPMEMKGRTMTGWLELSGPALDTDEALAEYVGIGVAHARSLPPSDRAPDSLSDRPAGRLGWPDPTATTSDH